MTCPVPIVDIDPDMETYPRKECKRTLVEQYVDALRGGARFPPILLEKGTKRLLSGLHRIEAYKRAAAQPELFGGGFHPDGTIEAEFVLVPDNIPRKLFRASLDLHGEKESADERKALAREVYQANPEFKQTDCAKYLGVSPATISGWVSDILATRREERQHKAWRLQLLGWSAQEMEPVLGYSHDTIERDLRKTSDLKKSVNVLLSSGHPVEEVARRFNLPEQLVWAAKLEEKTDQERFEALGWKLRTWDYWNWSDVDHRFGDEWDGRIPAQLVAHTLYFFTTPSDLILDPMAGGGTVSDVCLVMGRQCRSYEMVSKSEKRPEIEEWYWDPSDLRWPPSASKKPGLIFFDPPYYRKKEREYGQHSISALARPDYLHFFREWAALAAEYSKPTTRLALLMADWRAFESTPALEEDPTLAVTIVDYIREVEGGGWELTHIIYAPLSGQRFHPGMIDAMQERRILGTTNRFLLIFRRAQQHGPR